MASEHSLSLQALLGTAPLALDMTPWELRVVCPQVHSGCVFTLESDGVPSLSFDHGDGRPPL